jgi:hypothetical protein
MVMSEAWAQLWRAAKEIRERCTADVLAQTAAEPNAGSRVPAS